MLADLDKEREQAEKVWEDRAEDDDGEVSWTATGLTRRVGAREVGQGGRGKGPLRRAPCAVLAA